MLRKLLLVLLGFFSVSGAFAQAVQHAVIEEYTGAWCGYCPRGAITMQNILNSQPNAIGVALHNQDGMVTASGNSVTSNFNLQGYYPHGTVNRTGASVDDANWSGMVNNAVNGMTIASVSVRNVTYNSTTRALSATVAADFILAGNGTNRLNLWIVQDSVTGTGSNFNQVNYYNATVGHPMYNAGNPVIGYQHRHVLRDMLGGPWGSSNSCTDIAAGGHNEKTYTITLSTNFNADRIYLVGVLMKYDGPGISQRTIINAEEVKLTEAILTSSAPEMQLSEVIVYPNPTSDRVTMQFSLSENTNITAEVLDMNGRQINVIGDGFMNAGLHTLNWNGCNASGEKAANGIYFIRMTTESGKSYTSKVSMMRN